MKDDNTYIKVYFRELLNKLKRSIQSNFTKCATESKIDKAYIDGFNQGLEVALKLIDDVKSELR